MNIQLQCLQCLRVASLSTGLTSCPFCSGSCLQARYDLESLRQIDWPILVSRRVASLWRYEELLPVSTEAKISLGEGWTPLVALPRLGRQLGLNHLYLKDERQGPTASFKDRQASVAISLLSDRQIREVVLASTGNVAVAYSAYAVRGGIKLWVFFPQGVPEAKIREAKLYGTEVIRVNGTYDCAKGIAARFARERGLFLDRGLKTFAGVESMKTMAFEIAEQLGWRAPDWYIQGVSGGMGPVGVAKGFAELQALGLVEKMPALGLVQSTGCAPMVRSFVAGLPHAIPVTQPQTAIATLATGNPDLAYPLLRTHLQQYGGAMAESTDEEAYAMTRFLASSEGISVEPATAVTFVGLSKLAKTGKIAPDEVVVVNCSGHSYPVEPQIVGDLDYFVSDDEALAMTQLQAIFSRDSSPVVV